MPVEQVNLNFAKVKYEYEPSASGSGKEEQHYTIEFVNGAVDGGGEDSFHFTAEEAETNISLIAPAVQSAVNRGSPAERNSSDDSALAGDGAVVFITDSVEAGAADAGHDQWIDILSVDHGAHKPAADAAREANLRSDGELVQALSDADMSSDFIL